ncbi:unnamed protein product [Brassica napus]|uniref:(rape) hypothetical protein n=1 Tax=Brassica napus TaxID=3708 RepID=A0A816KDM8_BRANA|nr:unnamed protein product [Brassica napus]
MSRFYIPGHKTSITGKPWNSYWLMRICKRLTLRVKEDFFWLEYGNIRNFQVRPAGGAYRTTNHIYKISFNQATVVTRSNFMNDELYLNLVDFQSVLSETLDEKLLIGKNVIDKIYFK